MSYIIVCLIAGELVLQSGFKCPQDEKKKCWEIGQHSIIAVNSVLCGEYSPGGIFTQKPCPESQPDKYVIPLKCLDRRGRGKNGR